MTPVFANVALVIAVPVVPDIVKSPPVTLIEPEGMLTELVDIDVIRPFASTVIAGIAEALNKLPFVEFDYSGIDISSKY